MRRQRQPAVDQRQGAHRLGAIERQLQANQRPRAWPTSAKRAIPAACRALNSSPAIVAGAVAGGQRTGVLPGPVMVITHQLILFLQRRALRQPVAAAPPRPALRTTTGAPGHGAGAILSLIMSGYRYGRRWRFPPAHRASPVRTECRSAPVYRRGRTRHRPR